MLHETILHQMAERHAKNSGISPRLHDMNKKRWQSSPVQIFSARAISALAMEFKK
jgi:hypothetical protein